MVRVCDATYIEADDGDVESNVSLRDLLPVVIGTLALGILQVLLSPIEGLEELDHVLLVGFLRRGEAGLVDAVVDEVVRPLVCLVNLLTQGFRVELDVAVLFIDEVIKLGVEHADDLAALVADNSVLLLVVEDGDGEAAGVFLLGLEVDVAEVGEGFVAGYGVGNDVVAGDVGFAFLDEAPA